jgi:CRP-like cAMP-binding protein
MSAAPIAKAYSPDLWHVAGVRLFSRMDGAQRRDWEGVAARTEVPAGEVVPAEEAPLRSVWAVETGRVRLAPEGLTVEKRPTRPGAETSLVSVAEAGDIYGTFAVQAPGGERAQMVPRSLRDAVVWRVSADLFRQFLWKAGRWALPAPLEPRWRTAPAWRLVGPGLSAAHRWALGRGVALSGLWGRTAHSRAAWAVLELARRSGRFLAGRTTIAERFSAGRLARWVGADAEWARRWVAHAEDQGILHLRRGVCVVLRLWVLQQWEDRPWMEHMFEIPPDPWEEEDAADGADEVPQERRPPTLVGPTPDDQSARGDAASAP